MEEKNNLSNNTGNKKLIAKSSLLIGLGLAILIAIIIVLVVVLAIL
ncbi:hypothetical protein [[Mycoplasma] gypis]|uniref:Uncharacterized protein n=1 Tax=[Mycoplasma] gypis TaxID=92404 RepID=A0ABZ2RM63_9BACT|nr:hypothetical protein [[Mycoplasma] gypis]MBN0919205.1 hypothetical protein [[Mycoplasma] gypis]